MFSPTGDECTELIRAYYRAAGEVAKASAEQFSDPAQAAVAMLMGFQSTLVVRLAMLSATNQADAIERIQGLANDVKTLICGLGKSEAQ